MINEVRAAFDNNLYAWTDAEIRHEVRGLDIADAIAVMRGLEARLAIAEMTDDDEGCEGHPAGPFDPMGETTYCDGSCQAL